MTRPSKQVHYGHKITPVQSSHAVFPQVGGQINICEDGLPPWRVCQADPSKLVTPDTICQDGKAATDTPEVAQAIAQAQAKGGKTPEQLQAELKQSKTTIKSSAKDKP